MTQLITRGNAIVGSLNGVPIVGTGAGNEFLADDGTYKAAGGGGVQTATATVTTDPDTFIAQHVFDLGDVAFAYVHATLLSANADGETFGAGETDLTADILSIQQQGPGDNLWPQLNTVWSRDDPYQGVGSPPLDTHGMAGVSGRYIRINAEIQSNFSTYAGPNHPTASWSVVVHYGGGA